MTRLKVKPICAAIMLMSAYGVPALAQTSTDDTGAGADAVQAAPAVVQVTGMRQALRSAEAIKRDALQVVDAINADDIGKFPDRQAGDALQRVAGVQVGRDRGQTTSVIIRGLADVATTFDGNEIFTAAGRRLSYQDLPVQSIGGMEVYKSASANQFEGGIAGAVNIRLRSPFDARGMTGTAYLEDRINKTNGSSETSSKHNPGGGFLFSNRWNSGMGVLGQLPNIGGVYNSGKRKRESVHGAFGWKISPQLEASAEYLGMGYQARNAVNYILDIVTWAPRLTNVVLAPQGSHCNTSLGTICPILSANAAAAQFNVGAYDWDPYTATSTWGENERTTSHYLDLGLKYANGPLTLNSRLAYTRSRFVNDTVIVDQQIPGASSSVYAYGADAHGGYNSVTTPGSANALRDPNQFVLRGMVQNWNEQAGSQFQWRSDAVYRLGGDGPFSAVLAGVRLSSRKASYHGAEGHSDFTSPVRPSPVGAFGAGFEQLVPGLDRLGGPWVTPSSDFLIDQADTVRNAYGAPNGRVPDDPTRLFEQRERSATLYLAGRWKTNLGGVEVNGEAGARVVRLNRMLRGQNRIGDVVTDVDLSTSETNVLPAVSAIVSWTDALQSHLSAGKTITRPGFRELNPALSLIPPTVNAPGSGNAGNPYLEPTRSTNLDATLEYYFPKNGFAQVALFHRDIDGYLQNIQQDESIAGTTYRVTRPQNSGKGKLKGVELTTQKFFDFLPAPWSNFGAQFNYTWTDGENQTRRTFASDVFDTTALVDVAKNSYNLALLYEGHGISARLAATRRGNYVEMIAEAPFDQDRVVRATTFVDLSIGYELTRNLSLHFDGINLTRAKYESALGPYQPRDIRYNGTTYGLSLRYKM
jgi:iron complex outermembrane receptor protein